MPSRAKTVVDGFEWEDEFLAWTNSHDTRIINLRNTPLDLHLNQIIRQDSAVLNACDRARALYNARVDAEFQRQWQQACGSELMVSERSQNQTTYTQGSQIQHQSQYQPETQRKSLSANETRPDKRAFSVNDSQKCLRLGGGGGNKDMTGSPPNTAREDFSSDELFPSTGPIITQKRHYNIPSSNVVLENAGLIRPTRNTIFEINDNEQVLSPVTRYKKRLSASSRQTRNPISSPPDGSKLFRQTILKRKRAVEGGHTAAADPSNHELPASKRLIQDSRKEAIASSTNGGQERHAGFAKATSQESTGSTLVQRLRKEQTKKNPRVRPVRHLKKNNSSASSAMFEAPDNKDVVCQGTRPRLPASAPNPRYGQRSHSILDPYAVDLTSTQPKGGELFASSSGRKSLNNQVRSSAGNLGHLRADDGERLEKALVKDSEIDFDAMQSEEEKIIQRSQRGVKKEGSEDVAKRQMGKDKKLKGEVRKLKDGRGRAFRDVNNPNWTRGEYHYRLRSRFIDVDTLNHPPYVVEPESGNGTTDVTSRCTDQKDWTSDTDTIRDPHGKNLLVPDYRPGAFVEKNPPDWILEDGTVVLDLNGHPVRKFKNIPSTLSSAIEPTRMEGLRALTGMTINDLTARMPKYCETPDGRLQALQGPSAFTNRAKSWRDRQNLKPLKKGRPRKTSTEASKSRQLHNGSAKHSLHEEDSHSQVPKKRLRLGSNDPFDNEKGTAAQHAATQIRNRQKRKPRRSVQRQIDPSLPSIVGDQSSDSMGSSDIFGRLMDPQPISEPAVDPFATADKVTDWNDDPQLGEMVELEDLYESQFQTTESAYHPATINDDLVYHLAYQPVTRSSADLPLPAVPTSLSTQGQSCNSSRLSNWPYSPCALPGDRLELGPWWTESLSTQPSDQYGMHHPPTPELANRMGNPYRYQDPVFYLSPNESTSGVLSSNFDLYLQAAPLPDFRNYEPGNDEEMLEIEQALSRTLDSFEEAHPDDSAPATAWFSYSESKRMLETRHRELCQASGSRVTQLAGLGPWYHTLDNWPSARKI